MSALIGEKTKWVPIPAEELQAAADAQRTSRSHSSVHSRSRSHQHTISGSPGGSTSGRDSQHRSRAQSSRQSGSQVASTSHSRTQSRSGSLQSSPRHSAVRRRLPDELSGAQQRSLRSSRAASPQPQTFNTRDPLVTGVAAPMARYGGPYTHPYPDSQSESAYYPRDFSRGHSPYDIPPGMSSPMGPPYLPHGQYPPPPLPMPPSYPVGVPPYPVYQPYTYYGQPYVFWGGSSGQHSQDISQSHSPSTYPAPLTNSHPSPRLPPPAMPPSVTHASSEPIANEQDAGGQEKSRPRVLSFGTIDVASSATPVTNKSIGSSGPVSVATTSETATAPAPSSTDAGVDSSLPVFAIGLQPGDPGPSRKRGTSSAGLSVPDIVAGSSNSSAGPDATSASTSGPALAGEAAEADALVPEVADLSVSDQKWEFGSTQEGEQASAAPTEPASDVTLSATSVNTPLDDPRVRLSPLERIVDPTGLPPTPVPTSATVLYAAHSPLSPDSRSGDEFRVKDYGYGFGRPRGTAPSFVPREDRIPRDDRVPRESVPYNARPRRGSYNGGDTYERGGYLGRRGRGRGYGRGGRGYGDYSGPRRGLPRNQYSNMAPPVPYDTTYYPVHVPGGAYVTPGYDMYGQYTAPYNAAPPPIPATSSPTQAAAPVPIPVTRLSFPIDPLRYYLLGQLEYYLSEDNLAQDLYLRQNMDSRGWIPIPLIASFRRIKSLTYDFQLVKDVLTLSSLVEVNADWVRMNRWEQYVLPDAPSSSLEPEGAGPSNYAYHVNVEESILVHPPSAEVTINQHNAAQLQDPAPMASTPEVDDDEELEDEDEDDVEFVLGADTSAPWTPDPKTEL
ncbi:hypothetical protein BDW22DRAFT_182036 [Trametopsis cervina]|nr:hypothetical protein BDW22DRAFT_182036 [Trametopsis cervina]